MLGSNSNAASDEQPSQRTTFGSVSMPFLDMNSFQPARAKAQTGFDSMESMDSALASTKTTPLNYMRSSASNRNQKVTESIHSGKGEHTEDGSLNAFLRSSASAHSESNADLLNSETFGESSDPEPWNETPVTVHASLRQSQLPSDPDLNSFSIENLNLNSDSYQEGFEPYYARNSSDHHQQPPQPQVPARVQQQLQHLQYHQQQQHRQQGQFYGAPGQGNPLGAPMMPQYGQQPHQPMAGSSSASASPRHANQLPPSSYHAPQQPQQMYGAPLPHHHLQQHQQHQQQQPKPHQYNHGSYASAPHTPLSVYRPILQGSQHLSGAEDLDPLAAGGLMPGGPIGAGAGVGVAQHRAMYPSGGQPAGGPSTSSQARSPRNGYAPPLPHQQQPSYQQPPLHGQGPYAAPGMGPPPSSAMMNMQQELVYQVQFKRNCRAFTLRARAGFTVNERDFVVVEADRGEDIGIVVEIMTMHAFLERRMNAIRPSSQQGGGVEQEDQNVGCILRLATLHERQQLPDKFHAEKDIVQSCGDLAQHGFGLPITVFEAEFQFDRRKLTIFYDCTVRIDFRDFVRQLYSTYKARIWMKKMSPTAVPDIQPFAAMALATGVQFSSNAL